MQTKLQFFRHTSQLHRKFEGQKQVAIETTGYEMLSVTVML
jgi:hypothetical protein